MAKQELAARTAPKPRNPQIAKPLGGKKPAGLPPRNPAPVTKDNPIKVEAIATGYYDHIRRREGDVFVIANEQAFSARWMVRVDSRTPEKHSTAQSAIQKAHDEILGGASSGGLSSGTNVLGD